MYFKKQLYFALFMAIILVSLYVKSQSNQRIFSNTDLVTVVVTDIYCDRGSRLPDRSRLNFDYQGETHRLDLSKKRCLNLAIGHSMTLKYNKQTNTFLTPELLEAGYYSNIFIFLWVLLLLGLVPYKLFLK